MIEFLSLLAVGTVSSVIITVCNAKRYNKEIFKLRTEVRDLKELRKRDREDIEAIANAINVYSTNIQGTVSEKVKTNVNLFNEWIGGEEEE